MLAPSIVPSCYKHIVVWLLQYLLLPPNFFLLMAVNENYFDEELLSCEIPSDSISSLAATTCILDTSHCLRYSLNHLTVTNYPAPVTVIEILSNSRLCSLAEIAMLRIDSSGRNQPRPSYMKYPSVAEQVLLILKGLVKMLLLLLIWPMSVPNPIGASREE